MPIAPGQIIDGKYRVLRCIGKGGMGTVYEGENVRIERRVAIKVLHPHVAEMPEFAQRFEREARASARIGSPHVCDVLDFGDLPDGERFIVMEFLDGMSLEDRLADEKMSAITLAPIAFDLLEGLGTMHNVGVVHRDLKPANVFLSRLPNRRGDAVKILDFGVAKIVPKVDDAGGMTSTGMMMGTPLYMSPEQARGAREVDGRADLYSASVIFFRALSGALPYMADNLHELIFKIAIEEPRHIKEFCPELDDEFASMIMKGLARDRAQRFQSARDYQLALAAWGRNQGRASLAFAVTLSSEPPPVLHSSGGLPVAKSGASSSPPTAVLPSSSSRRNVASGGAGTTPAGLGASPLPDSRNASPMALGKTTPSTPSGSRDVVDVVDPRGTPTAWSGHTPLMPGADRPGVGSDPPRATSNAPRTTPSPALTKAAPSKGPGKTLAAIGGIFGLLAIAVVLVVVRSRTGGGPKTVGVDAPAPLESVGSVAKAADPPPAPTEAASGADRTDKADPGIPAAVASASAAPPGTPVAHAPAPIPNVPRNREPGKADPSKAPPVASSVAAPVSAPPAPAPPPSGSGKRKFRTDID